MIVMQVQVYPKKKKSEQFETLKLKPQVLERSAITTDLQTAKKVGVSS